MVRKLAERFTQTVGNYEITITDNMSENEEIFVETLNRMASLAYTLNDMVRFFGMTLDEIEDEVSDAEWKKLTNNINRINYQLHNCKNILSDTYNDLENR